MVEGGTGFDSPIWLLVLQLMWKFVQYWLCLAWALNKKVVMISGCTSEDNEFKENNYRVINKNVCNGSAIVGSEKIK